MALSSKWLQFCKTHEERDDLITTLHNNRYLLDLLEKIILRELSEQDKTKLSGYSNPNWAYARADKDGVVRTLRQILTLVQKDDKSNA